MNYTGDERTIIAEARRLHKSVEMYFDDWPQPKVKFEKDGAWVQAWVFVPWNKSENEPQP